jgi:hypothetical protein
LAPLVLYYLSSLQADKGDKTVKDLVQLLFDTSLLASGGCRMQPAVVL